MFCLIDRDIRICKMLQFENLGWTGYLLKNKSVILDALLICKFQTPNQMNEFQKYISQVDLAAILGTFLKDGANKTFFQNAFGWLQIFFDH